MCQVRISICVKNCDNSRWRCFRFELVEKSLLDLGARQCIASSHDVMENGLAPDPGSIGDRWLSRMRLQRPRAERRARSRDRAPRRSVGWPRAFDRGYAGRGGPRTPGLVARPTALWLPDYGSRAVGFARLSRIVGSGSGSWSGCFS
jgi:hypothetical protein